MTWNELVKLSKHLGYEEEVDIYNGFTGSFETIVANLYNESTPLIFYKSGIVTNYSDIIIYSKLSYDKMFKIMKGLQNEH